MSRGRHRLDVAALNLLAEEAERRHKAGDAVEFVDGGLEVSV